MPRAEIDTDHIYSWIAERSPEGARRWWLALEETRTRPAHNPLNPPRTTELSFSGHVVRQILFKTRQERYYRVLYVVVGHEVRILRVRGPGQPELLNDELD